MERMGSWPNPRYPAEPRERAVKMVFEVRRESGQEKAAIAVARTLICIAWAVMARGQDYTDAGEDYYDQRDQRNREHLIRHHQHALARLGCQATLIPPGDGSPSPGPGSLTASSPHWQPSEPAPPALPRPGWGPQVSLQRLSN